MYCKKCNKAIAYQFDYCYEHRQERKIRSVYGNNGEKMKYQISYNIGKVKYLVSYSNGTKKHKDGSEFWDIVCFSNKKKMGKFIKNLG